MTPFADLLREKRVGAGKTLGDVARCLGFTISYISDVERGRRYPFKDELIVKLADFLEAEREEFLDAAAKSRGSFELDAVNVSPKARHVGAALMRGWNDLSDEELDQIEEIIGTRHGKEGQ